MFANTQNAHLIVGCSRFSAIFSNSFFRLQSPLTCSIPFRYRVSITILTPKIDVYHFPISNPFYSFYKLRMQHFTVLMGLMLDASCYASMRICIRLRRHPSRWLLSLYTAISNCDVKKVYIYTIHTSHALAHSHLCNGSVDHMWRYMRWHYTSCPLPHVCMMCDGWFVAKKKMAWFDLIWKWFANGKGLLLWDYAESCVPHAMHWYSTQCIGCVMCILCLSDWQSCSI